MLFPQAGAWWGQHVGTPGVKGQRARLCKPDSGAPYLECSYLREQEQAVWTCAFTDVKVYQQVTM